MSRTELEIVESAGKITELTGYVLHNCDYCEDQGMDVKEIRKALQWLLAGAVQDLEKMNSRLKREYELWQPND